MIFFSAKAKCVWVSVCFLILFTMLNLDHGGTVDALHYFNSNEKLVTFCSEKLQRQIIHKNARIFKKNDWYHHHKFFGLFFIPADGRAKSAQQLILTLLPFQPLYFPWSRPKVCSSFTTMSALKLLIPTYFIIVPPVLVVRQQAPSQWETDSNFYSEVVCMSPTWEFESGSR